MSASRRFLLAMWDGGGTVPPELGVAKRLIARGHQVRVLGDPTIEAEAEAAGCGFTPWTTAPHRKSRDRADDIIRDYAGGSMLKLMNDYMDEFLGAPAPRFVADTLAELEAHPADVFLCDQFLPATSIAAEKLGLPSAALSPQIWMVPTRGIPPLGTGFRPSSFPLWTLRDALIRRLMTAAFDKALPALNGARALHGLDPVRSTYEQILKPDVTLVLTTPAFDFVSPHLPEKAKYVGPMLDDPSWAAPVTSPNPAGEAKPLVLVSLSSIYQDQVETLRNIVAGLASLPVRAIVTLGESVRAEEVQGCENVRVLVSAPHTELLKETSVLVTHSGHGTTMKGLAAGVPLVCVPMGRDQHDNATRVVERGAGVRVSKNAPPAKFAAAVTEVLGNPRYRQGAQRLAHAIRSGEGCVDAVEVLEMLGGVSPAAGSAARRRALLRDPSTVV
ncbi:MAG: glycosyltransferase family 1 protein [Myxococcales bacterium]|nr:glycosyltransferase family 1 protein [Myxococcales bacterium]